MKNKRRCIDASAKESYLKIYCNYHHFDMSGSNINQELSDSFLSNL